MKNLKLILILATFSAFFFFGKSVFAVDFYNIPLDTSQISGYAGTANCIQYNGFNNCARIRFKANNYILQSIKITDFGYVGSDTLKIFLTSATSSGIIASTTSVCNYNTQCTFNFPNILLNINQFYYFQISRGSNNSIALWANDNVGQYNPDYMGLNAHNNSLLNVSPSGVLIGTNPVCGDSNVQGSEFCDSDTIACGSGVDGTKTCNATCTAYDSCIKSSSAALTTISGGVITKSTEIANFGISNFWGYFLIIIILIVLLGKFYYFMEEVREKNMKEEDEKLIYERPEKRKIKFKKYRED